ncbi:hypothetical protein ACQR1K_09975 [Bradyrhizobium sp. HKCCYLRH3095]|uniref:hypothetical protein n=1 Tax=Bradyrhizobium sp. HKCCYLRH3095 TaxID=3420765 RepID=UPI003EB7FB6A
MPSLEPIEIVISEAEPGPPGPMGPPGPASAFFEYAQTSPLNEWIVNHNLGFRPSVAVVDDGGNAVLAAVAHPSVNQCRISFALPMAGRARCC